MLDDWTRTVANTPSIKPAKGLVVISLSNNVLVFFPAIRRKDDVINSSDKIKNTIKDKITKSKKDKYQNMNIDDLRKISKDRLNILKSKYNIDK